MEIQTEQKGHIISYNIERGFGFIYNVHGSYFFHISGLVDRAHPPQENEEVFFELAEDPKTKKIKAVNVQRVL